MKHFSLNAYEGGEHHYIDRIDAGRRLAKVLRSYKGADTVVLGLPRGGVVVAAEVAKELNAPLSVILARKIVHPFAPEYAIGAMSENFEAFYNPADLQGVDEGWLKKSEAQARELIDERRRLYFGQDFVPPELKNKELIIVDDGIATGMTMQAAVMAAKSQKPRQVIVAVPVAPKEVVASLEAMADEVITLDQPEYYLGAVGTYYDSFEQTDDEEVRTLLREVRDVQQTTTRNRALAHSS